MSVCVVFLWVFVVLGGGVSVFVTAPTTPPSPAWQGGSGFCELGDLVSVGLVFFFFGGGGCGGFWCVCVWGLVSVW